MTIHAVLFDLDGTLLDRDSSLLQFVRDQHQRYPELQFVEKDVFAQRFIELDNHGYVWKDKVYQQLVDEFSIQNLDWILLLEDYISNFQKHCIGFPNLLSMLTQLKDHNLKLALVSNGFGQFQYDNFKALHIEHLFDEILISEWEGLRKPDQAIFNSALTKLGVHAKNAVFVGDHPDNDIRASRDVGMRAVWKRNGQVEAVVDADAIIDDLEELAAIVIRKCDRNY
ncbi:putative hydrolase of the HAD superfamily [Paenibacillus sp. UNCCL117]|uniref:HAD family hydrolase n=1 Tax=unclassified Paenibacillus TaxID=185978 RepID=UPI0008838AE3|nr:MULTISPECIES: HAD family hydrolase [unclassified Paenibacillus]SDC75548.1 putative hydrolase of the HAD superfamily [Paenibacillus sp. cl123]SFW25424.1 putative hydrolase of the HAD superfamily [Paenibacillus sp. UNCCL117]